MKVRSKHQIGLFGVMLLLPALCTCQNYFTSSRTTYYGSPDCNGNPRGACGFRDYGGTVNDGSVAGVSRLWRDGSGCGACYQVRCKNPEYCDDYGAFVVATDYGEGDTTDFIMSPRAYSRLGRNPDASAQLFKYGVVDVEFRRVPCRFAGDNIIVKVHEYSKYPAYLAIVILYVPGQYDVTAVEIWHEDRQIWRPMRRAFGAVFDTASPPRGQNIGLRFYASGSAGVYRVQSKSAIPSDWKAGAAYDSQVKLD